jgi:hypothetical protein
MTTRLPRGGLLRFSLRSLLVVVTLLAVGLGVFVYWREAKRREAVAGDWVLNHGGSIAEFNSREAANPSLWVRCLERLLPEQCLRTVYFVDFLDDPKDADLEILRDLPNLKQLNLNQANNVTPAGLAPLAELPKLEVLYLMNTPVGDAGLAQVRNLHGLKEIWVGHTGITDASMPWIASNPELTHLGATGAQITDQSAPLLARLHNLETLSLADTQITSRGLADIAKLPRLKHLYLLRTAVDDEGLKHLEQTKSLKILAIQLTRTTAAGRESFQKAVPGCLVEVY